MFERALLLCWLSAVLLCACSGGDDDIACFAAGTPVATPGGEVAIEDLQPGDRVLSLDRASGAVVPVTVTHVRVHRDRIYRLLELPGGARLGVTDNHPVFEASSGGFVPAGRLSNASRLVFLAGGATAVGSGLRVAGEGRGDVYDLSVTGDHVFFASGVLVHNKSPDADPPIDANACADDVNACQIWPGLPPDTIHGYLFDGCDTTDCCIQPSDWWATGTFAEEPEEGATATPLERALPDPDGAYQITPSEAARFLCAGQPLDGGDLVLLGACTELAAPPDRIDFVSGPGGGVWLACGS